MANYQNLAKMNRLPFIRSQWFIYLKFLVRHFMDDECQQKSASLTYTTLLSLIPIITVMIVVFSVIPALADAREQLQSVIYDTLIPTSKATISGYIDSFAEKSKNLGIIGIVGLFVTTIMTLLTIEEAFNKIWRVHERTSFMASVVRYWLMITLAPVVLGVAFGASGAVQGMDFLNQQVGGYGIDWAVTAQVVSFVVMTMGFIGMYWFIPKAQVPIKHAIIAGVVVAILFETLKHTFGLIMTNFTSYEAIYGAFAALPIFLLWIYLSWNVILLGVEISYTLTIFDPKSTQPSQPVLSLLSLLDLTYQHHKAGKTISEHELRSLLKGQELASWYEYINHLVDHKLITHAKDDSYILRTDLNSVNLWHFYKTLPYPLPTQDELLHHAKNHPSPWVITLAHHLKQVEALAQNEMNVTLSALFDGKTAVSAIALPAPKSPTPPPTQPAKDTDTAKPTTPLTHAYRQTKAWLLRKTQSPKSPKDE